MQKWLFSHAAFVSALCVVLLVMLALTIVNLQPRTSTRIQAEAIITPSFFPLAPCPTCLTPSQAIISSSPTTPPLSAHPSPTLDPCEAPVASIAHDRRRSKHKNHRGAISKFIEQLMQFFLELLNRLIELLGGQPRKEPQVPQQPVQPSRIPIVTLPENPQISQPQGNPCNPTQIPSAAPQPTVIQPSTIVPSVLSPVPSISGPQTSQIDLSNWKLQLPTGKQGKVDEVKQPQLATFSRDPWYITNPGGGLRFRAAVNGVTTSGSKYPRSELREMNGTANAAWSPATGTHTMTIEQAITAVPKTKKHVVAGQIHDSSDDIIVVRLELPKLFIKIGDTSGPTLDANYTLGKKFTVKFEAKNGQTAIYYNGGTTPAYTMNKSYSSAYFKAGAYTQSNCTTEASADCNENNYGEVVIYNLNVTHQ